MVNGIGNVPEVIRELKRQAIESFYWDTMDVLEHRKVQEDDSEFTRFEWAPVAENVPCRASMQTTDPTINSPAKYGRIVMVTTAPEIEIKPGARILLRYRGREELFVRGSDPRHYSDHQTVSLEAINDEENYA